MSCCLRLLWSPLSSEKYVGGDRKKMAVDRTKMAVGTRGVAESFPCHHLKEEGVRTLRMTPRSTVMLKTRMIRYSPRRQFSPLTIYTSRSLCLECLARCCVRGIKRNSSRVNQRMKYRPVSNPMIRNNLLRVGRRGEYLNRSQDVCTSTAHFRIFWQGP